MSALDQALAALRRDLIHEDGPRISTMHNYRFAILQYDPAQEYDLRAGVQRLGTDLMAHGWHVLSISLQKLLVDRLRNHGDSWVERVIASERRLSAIAPERGLNYLKEKLATLVEGPEGIAADCARIIREHASQQPAETLERTVAFIGRAGALYPFYRSSALLRHLDGQTMKVPVVLLYPGQRHGATGLSFMGLLEPDHDYRPRIYP